MDVLQESKLRDFKPFVDFAKYLPRISHIQQLRSIYIKLICTKMKDIGRYRQSMGCRRSYQKVNMRSW